MTTAAGVPAPERDPNVRRLAYVLDVLFVLLLVAVAGLVAAGERGGETFTSNLVLSIPALAAALAALAGGVVAAFALRRDRPVSAAGRLALRGALALPLAFLAAVVVGSLLEDVQPVLVVALNVATLAILVAAPYARFARGDRAAALVVPLLLGVVVAFWLVFELALPH